MFYCCYSLLKFLPSLALTLLTLIDSTVCMHRTEVLLVIVESAAVHLYCRPSLNILCELCFDI